MRPQLVALSLALGLLAPSAMAQTQTQAAPQGDTSELQLAESAMPVRPSDASDLRFQWNGFGYVAMHATPADDRRAKLNVAFTHMRLTWQLGAWDLRLAPRFKITPAKPGEYRARLFLQSAYLRWKPGATKVRLGRLNHEFGRTFNYGFDGPILDEWDLKTASDLGVDVETRLPLAGDIGLGLVAQYFGVDGAAIQRERGSLDVGFNASRHNIVNLGIKPIWQPGPGRLVELNLSGQRYDTAEASAHAVAQAAARDRAGLERLRGVPGGGPSVRAQLRQEKPDPATYLSVDRPERARRGPAGPLSFWYPAAAGARRAADPAAPTGPGLQVQLAF